MRAFHQRLFLQVSQIYLHSSRGNRNKFVVWKVRATEKQKQTMPQIAINFKQQLDRAERRKVPSEAQL